MLQLDGYARTVQRSELPRYGREEIAAKGGRLTGQTWLAIIEGLERV